MAVRMASLHMAEQRRHGKADGGVHRAEQLRDNEADEGVRRAWLLWGRSRRHACEGSDHCRKRRSNVHWERREQHVDDSITTMPACVWGS